MHWPPARRRRNAASAPACAILAGCAAGPDYHRPDSTLPADWRPEAPWRAAAPDDAQLKGDWWILFADPVLDQLERQAARQSPTLAAAAVTVATRRTEQSVKIRAQSGDLSQVTITLHHGH